MRKAAQMKEWKMLESNTRKFIQSLEDLGGPPLYQLSYEQAREVLNRVQAEAKVQKLPVGVRDEVLPVGPWKFRWGSEKSRLDLKPQWFS
jgi:acetyl esterase